jgi:hypothetical protein
VFLNRPAGESAGPRTVRPGLHVIGHAADQRYDVLWWDPHTLNLNAPRIFGVRRQELISRTDPETVAAGHRAYDDWRHDRDSVLERAQQPTISAQTVAARARQKGADIDEAAADVTVVDAVLGIPKPGGRRFGTLIHAVLAMVPLTPPRSKSKA